VRLEIPRTAGWREWGAAAALEQSLEAQTRATVTGPHIESETATEPRLCQSGHICQRRRRCSRPL